MEKLNVEGHPNLYRDLKSGAIINDNSVEYQNYMQMYRKKQRQTERIDNIENELSEIKQLLHQLLKNYE
jgi:hypothetical protein